MSNKVYSLRLYGELHSGLQVVIRHGGTSLNRAVLEAKKAILDEELEDDGWDDDLSDFEFPPEWEIVEEDLLDSAQKWLKDNVKK